MNRRDFLKLAGSLLGALVVPVIPLGKNEDVEDAKPSPEPKPKPKEVWEITMITSAAGPDRVYLYELNG